jgi:hypothetical protein
VPTLLSRRLTGGHLDRTTTTRSRRIVMPTTTTSPVPTRTGPATAYTADKDGTPYATPVVIVRPATVALPRLSAAQRNRRRAAIRLATDLTDAAVHGRAMRWTNHEVTWCFPTVSLANRPAPNLDDDPDAYSQYVDVSSEEILRDAPDIAAAPAAGAVQVGRDRFGHPVAVVVHAQRWTLVIDAARLGGHGWPPVSCVFLDRPTRPDPYDRDNDEVTRRYGRAYLATGFDDERDRHSVAWTGMLAHLVATAARPAACAAPRPGARPWASLPVAA